MASVKMQFCIHFLAAQMSLFVRLSAYPCANCAYLRKKYMVTFKCACVRHKCCSHSNCACCQTKVHAHVLTVHVSDKCLFIFLTVHVKLAHTCMYHTQAYVNVLALLVSYTSACSCSICEGIRLKCLFMFYLCGCHSDAYSCFVCSCVRLRGIFMFYLLRCQTQVHIHVLSAACKDDALR